MNLDFRGYGENVATFLADETVEMGHFVVVNDNFTVTAAKENDKIFGLCVGTREGYAAVQLSGYIEAPSCGCVRLGYVGLVSASATNVKESKSGEKYRVIFSKNGVVGFLL